MYSSVKEDLKLPYRLCKELQGSDARVYLQQATLLVFIQKKWFRGWMEQAIRLPVKAYSPQPFTTYFRTQPLYTN